jgi:hypothetical protein
MSKSGSEMTLDTSSKGRPAPLDTRLLPGRYTVQFGLGNPRYPVTLTKDSRFTQAEIEAGVGGSAQSS